MKLPGLVWTRCEECREYNYVPEDNKVITDDGDAAYLCVSCYEARWDNPDADFYVSLDRWAGK